MSRTVSALPALLPAVTLACLVAPVTATAAAPTFGAPITLKPASTAFVGTPVVSASSSGDLAVAWPQQLSKRQFGIVVRRGTSAGRFGRAQRVSVSGYGPSVAAGRGGGAALIWQTDAHGGTRRVQVAVARGHGRFGAPRTLATVRANVTSEQVLASGGRYVAIWWQGVPGSGQHAVRYAVSGTTGVFGPVQTLVPNTGPITGVSAAAAPDGSITAAWGTPLGGTVSTNQQLAFARLAAGATRFGPITTVRSTFADAGAEAVGIGVSAGPGGTALTWTEEGHLPELLRAGPLASGTAIAPETVFTLDSNDLGRRYAAGPVLAQPAGGIAPVAAWAVVDSPGGESEAITGGQVLAAIRAANGTYGDVVQLSTPGTIATQPTAVAMRSTSVVAWTTGQFGRYGLHYAVRSGSDGFDAARALTASHAERAPVLASSNSTVIAAWTSRPGPGGAHLGGARRGIAVAIMHDRS